MAQSQSVKINVAYKGLLTISKYVIGFITFPYITRVLGPNNFGLVNFALNTIDYFLLFATLGITTIGTREIAETNGDSLAQGKAFSQILGLNLICTLITLAVYLCIIVTVPQFEKCENLLLIGSAKILFTAFAIEWFFTGIENFKYITYRSLLVNIIYVIAVFVFVRKSSDYVLYFILTIAAVVVSAIINFVYARKYVIIKLKEFISSKYLKQNLKLGIYAIMTSMYITFNVVYLGFVSSEEEVGFYSTAVKLYFVAINLFSAYTSVLMPRMSSLISSNDITSMQGYLNKSFRLVFLTAIPIIAIAIPFAQPVIELIAGDGYLQAVIPMRILMPALIFVWISQVIALQGLVPLKADSVLLHASILGGVLAILLNLFLTSKLGAIGSALTLLCCEVIVTFYYIVIIRKNKLFKLPPLKSLSHSLLIGLPYIIISILCYCYLSGYIGLSVACICSLVYFLFHNPLKSI